jgi:hypothetical protein
MDYTLLDADKDQDIIIPRALYMTNFSSFNADIAKLETLYSSEQIITVLKATKERISNEVCEMVSKRYSIPVFHRFSLF